MQRLRYSDHMDFELALPTKNLTDLILGIFETLVPFAWLFAGFYLGDLIGALI